MGLAPGDFNLVETLGRIKREGRHSRIPHRLG
jgi:hypothetical protein